MAQKPMFVIVTGLDNEDGFNTMFGKSAEITKDDDGDFIVKLKSPGEVTELDTAVMIVKRLQESAESER